MTNGWVGPYYAGSQVYAGLSLGARGQDAVRAYLISCLRVGMEAGWIRTENISVTPDGNHC